ncbi:hypothetical protein NZD89_25605 [Alicyclobacillus fastidiosus]|uniref:Uncharacterized protein n=1 Tax=Alicyclobacillus fastidiosus TaxID=392011 RepID=A0ABY6ZFR1_9BACL|nr:hypothetical protein [Alicyclobacillus fastidiosus]WAH41575.1 hypothetical protein NZD89_25605 [Alicyclobacillus fastidiosus]GMA63234.1 hypothetical protein GCM10025859_36740 [Alicyclobacillus fastidiosus]
MLRFILAMVIPVIIFIYTMSFTRWMSSQKHLVAATSAALLGVVTLFASGATIWKLLN